MCSSILESWQNQWYAISHATSSMALHTCIAWISCIGTYHITPWLFFFFCNKYLHIRLCKEHQILLAWFQGYKRSQFARWCKRCGQISWFWDGKTCKIQIIWTALRFISNFSKNKKVTPHQLLFIYLFNFDFPQLSGLAPNLSLKGTPYWMAPEVLFPSFSFFFFLIQM